jgi:nucleoside-diphosphate kinase
MNTMSPFTIALIKPDVASDEAKTAEIVWQIITRGFEIIESRSVKLTLEQAQQFYAVHRERPFFPDLTVFMASGPLYALKITYLEDPAQTVSKWREVIGASDSSTPGSIRAMFGNPQVTRENAVHGSDSEETAIHELQFFFVAV